MKPFTRRWVFFAVFLVATNGWADGIFVAPKFVWDKHKDINEPTQKAIIVYANGQEDLVLQVKYEGPLDQFGWLVPVPGKPSVRLGSMKCFYELSRFTQQQQLDLRWQGARAAAYGVDDKSASGPPPVQIVETKTVGAYDITVLSAKDPAALKQWLEDNHFYVPPDKSNVLDAYTKMGWYFVAVKIALNRWSSSFNSTSNQLASGELNPLQISFASDRCIFPLRISSINGKPSEVQMYVLAAEPLLEQGLFEQELPAIYSNDDARMEQYEQRVKQIEQRLDDERAERGLPPPPDKMPRPKMPLSAAPDEVMEFYKAGPGDLTGCARMLPRLAARSWWIMKKTRTFASDEMRDLDFGPALPVLAETLGSSKYGYIASQDISLLAPDAVPVVLAAVQGSSPALRANAAGVLEISTFKSDPRIKAAAPALLKNPEPKARLAAIDILTGNSIRDVDVFEEMLPLLEDSDPEVRDVAVWAVGHSPDAQKFAPQFHKMLTDTNPAVQIAGLRIIQLASLPISHDELLPFFKIPDERAVGISTGYFRDVRGQYDLSNEQAIPLLHNSEPVARVIGLRILGQNAAADSIELASPLLDDPNPTVQRVAARVIRQLEEQ